MCFAVGIIQEPGMNMFHWVTLAALSLSAAACNRNAAPTASAGEPRPPQSVTDPIDYSTPPHINYAPYSGPKVRITQLPRESTQSPFAQQIEVIVPSNGWSMRIDEDHVVDGKPQIFITLEGPAKNELVTLTPATLRKNFTTAARGVSWEVYVHLAQRGVRAQIKEYQFAARSEPSDPHTWQEQRPSSDLPRTSAEKYAGPPAKLRVLQRESHPVQYVAEAVVTAPTGGWTLALDEGHVINGTASVFLTLEKPAEDEMVTQALVDHRKLFSTTERFTAVDVYIHLAQRGVETLTTDYRLAARSAIPTPPSAPSASAGSSASAAPPASAAPTASAWSPTAPARSN
jgi:hypothetical protein